MYAISGRLISAKELKEHLTLALHNAENRVSIASAYLTCAALEWAAGQIQSPVAVRILTRWQPSDLLSGASDLAAYEFAVRKEWPFYVQEDFHGKAYLIDRHSLFTGSTNLTSRGLNLYGSGNDEINVRTDVSPENLAFVDDLFQRATLMHREVYVAIKSWVEEHNAHTQVISSPVWPEEVAMLLTPGIPPDRLFVAECFCTDGSWVLGGKQDLLDEERKAIACDLSLLGLPQEVNPTDLDPRAIATRLRRTKIYAWLREKLRSAEANELYFGALSALLHNSLLDDPTPYRSEVKMLLANLLAWIDRSEMEEIRVDRPNQSQRVTLHVSGN